MARNGRYVVGLDIGTAKICCVIAELQDDGALHLAGAGETPSRGLRKGVVANVDATVEAIKTAVGKAEMAAGVNVEHAIIGIAGGYVRSFNSRGVVAVSGRDHTVSAEDVARVLAAAQAVTIPQDREIVHVLPQEYMLDDQGGITQPRGLVGARLEANVHIVTSATHSIQNLVTCVNRAGIEVRDTVIGQLAAAEAVLTQDERDLGVALLDIGGGSTDLAIFEHGSLWYTATLPVGGEHFTNDLAVGLRTPVPEAERLKLEHGCALASMVQDQGTIEVASVGGRQPRLLSLQVLAEILQPRAVEIFTLIREEIGRAGFDRSLNAGIVFSGGGSLLPGMVEAAEQVFDLPVRLGQPQLVEDPASDGSSLRYATAIGLALYGARARPPRRVAGQLAVPLGGFGGRFKSWVTGLFAKGGTAYVPEQTGDRG